jgi:hypothetical protein
LLIFQTAPFFCEQPVLLNIMQFLKAMFFFSELLPASVNKLCTNTYFSRKERMLGEFCRVVVGPYPGLSLLLVAVLLQLEEDVAKTVREWLVESEIVCSIT